MPPRSTCTPLVRIDLEGWQSGADRDIERAAGQLEHVPRDHEAFECRRGDARVRAGGELIDAGDVAVRLEPAQLALEPVHQIESRLRGLCRVLLIGVDRVDLVHRRHRLVREAPDVALGSQRLERESATDFGLRVGRRSGLHQYWLPAPRFRLRAPPEARGPKPVHSYVSDHPSR
jgi:hypothetical protein